MTTYHFHGIRVQSVFPLGLPSFENASSQRVLKELCIRRDPYPPLVDCKPVWSDPQKYQDGTPIAHLYHVAGHPVLEAVGIGFFRFESEQILVDSQAEDYELAPFLLGRVFALWLELNGVPLLHGSCVHTTRGAIALLGDSGMGKSTLSAALVNHGRLLLTDDLIPLFQEKGRPLILPGIPMSRIWPSSAALVPNFESAELIHPKGTKRKVLYNNHGGPRFAEQPEFLNEIYVLDRSATYTEPRIEELSPAAALMALVQLSYRPELIQILGLQPKRLPLLAAVTQSVKVRKLVYPTGFGHLDEVCRMLIDGK